MLRNPFTPSSIASRPEDFFGRADELNTLERSLQIGSVAIQGPIGIGKSSLLARGRLLIEGFGSENKATSVVGVAHKDVTNVDEAARLLLERFVAFDEKHSKVCFKIGSVVEIESGELVRLFAEGRHLASLERILEKKYLQQCLEGDHLLVLAIDEADKAAAPLARLVRAVLTHTQQEGVNNIRFVLAGVSPFFQKMVSEDEGVNRFFYKTIMVEPMPVEDAHDLVTTKLSQVRQQAENEGIGLRIAPDVISRIVALSGGHPHILQLLGSHLVENEDADPDGVLDAKDLSNALRRICREDRARVYDATVHKLELEGRLDEFATLIREANRSFPTEIKRSCAIKVVEKEALAWFVDHNILRVRSDATYGLVDEFLRVWLLLNMAESDAEEARVEHDLILRANRRLSNESFEGVVESFEDEMIQKIDDERRSE